MCVCVRERERERERQTERKKERKKEREGININKACLYLCIHIFERA